MIGRPTAGGLSIPDAAPLDDHVVLMYPVRRIASVRTGSTFAHNQLVPDDLVANATAADYASSRDPQLAAALAWLAHQK